MRRMRNLVFTQHFNDLLKTCGKSVYEVAQLSGLSPTYVHRVATGERLPSPRAAALLMFGLVGDKELFQLHPELVDAFNLLLTALINDGIGAL
jgi:hypothetical protein